MIESSSGGGGSSGAPMIDVATGKVLGIHATGVPESHFDQTAYTKILQTIDPMGKPDDFELPSAVSGIVRLWQGFFESQALIPVHSQIEALKLPLSAMHKCFNHFKDPDDEVAGYISNTYADIYRSNDRETLIFIREENNFFKIIAPKILNPKPSEDEKVSHFRVKMPNGKSYLIRQTLGILSFVPEFILLADDQNIKTDQIYSAVEMTEGEIEILNQMRLGSFNKFADDFLESSGVYSNDPSDETRNNFRDTMQKEVLKPNTAIPQMAADCAPLMIPRIREIWLAVTK